MSDKETRARLEAVMVKVNEGYTPDGAVKPIVAWAGDLPPVRFIPTSIPALNYALACGGWPVGKIIELIGPDKAGKTTVLNTLFTDHLEAFPDKYVAMVDIEHRYNPEWAHALGVPQERLVVTHPANAEDAADIMRELIRTRAFAAVGFDSIGAAQPSAMTEAFADQPTRPGGAAAVMGRTVRMSAADGDLFDTTVCYMNQIRAVMDTRPGAQYGWSAPGGHAVKHGASVIIELRRGSTAFHVPGPKLDKDKKAKPVEVGRQIQFRVTKNTYGPYPREAWSSFFSVPSEHFQDAPGFDVEADYANLGVALGVVERAGAQYSWGGVKAQGRDRFFERLREEGRFQDYVAAVEARFKDGPAEIEGAEPPDESEPTLSDEPTSG